MIKAESLLGVFCSNKRDFCVVLPLLELTFVIFRLIPMLTTGMKLLTRRIRPYGL